MKASESEPQMKCRNALDDIKSGECSFSRDESGGCLFIDQVVSGMHAARAWVRLLHGTWEPVVSWDDRPVVCDLRWLDVGEPQAAESVRVRVPMRGTGGGRLVVVLKVL